MLKGKRLSSGWWQRFLEINPTISQSTLHSNSQERESEFSRCQSESEAQDTHNCLHACEAHWYPSVSGLKQLPPTTLQGSHPLQSSSLDEANLLIRRRLKKKKNFLAEQSPHICMDYDTSKVQQQITVLELEDRIRRTPLVVSYHPHPLSPLASIFVLGRHLWAPSFHLWAKATCKSSMSLSSVGDAEYVGEKQNPLRIIIGHCSYIKDNRSETQQLQTSTSQDIPWVTSPSWTNGKRED